MLHYISRLCFTALILISGTMSFGQQVDLYNGGVNLRVNTNGSIYVKDGRYIQDDNHNNEYFLLSGKLITDKGVFGRQSNTNNMFKLLTNGDTIFGHVYIRGGFIKGLVTPRFPSLTIDNNANISLDTNAMVIDSLFLKSGKIDVKSNLLQLYFKDGSDYYNGKLIGENATNHLIGDAGELKVEYPDPFNKVPGVIPTNNLNFAGVGAHVTSLTNDFNKALTISRVFDPIQNQTPTNSFKTYYKMRSSSNISDPKITINYFDHEKPPSSAPAKYRIFVDDLNNNSSYSPEITTSDAANKKVYSTRAAITTATQRYVIGECPSEPVSSLQEKYSVCTNDSPLRLDAKESSHAANFTYQWYKNDVPIVGAISNLYAITATDHYAVLITNPTTGCFNFHEFNVWINPSPNNINFNLPAPKCQNVALTYSNTTQNLATGNYKDSKWRYESTTSAQAVNLGASPQDGQFTYTNAGTYDVQLIMETDSGCLDTAIKQIQIDPQPLASLTTADAEQCANEKFTINNNSSVANTFGSALLTSAWQINGASQAAPTGSVTAPLVFSRVAPPGPASRVDVVSLTVTSNKGCINSTSLNVTVPPMPSATAALNINPARNPIAFCIDTAVSFSATSVLNTASYNWDFGDATTNSIQTAKRTQQNPAGVQYENAGTFTPKLVLTSNRGCKDTMNITNTNATVHPLPTPTFSLASNSVCFDTAVALTNSVVANTTYSWNFGDGTTSNSQGASVNKSYTATGNYNITLNATSQFGCKADSVKQVRIKPKPVVSFTVANKCEDSLVTFNPTVNSSPTGSPALVSPTYQWSFGSTNADANNAAQRTVLAPNVRYRQHSGPGTFTPTFYAVAEGCRSLTATNNITIHPNPVAQFTGGNNCNGDQIGFTNVSTIDNPGTNTYNWNMGDGNTSLTHAGSFNYTYTNQSSASYNVTLKATSNQGCIADTTVVVKNYALPKASWNDSLTDQCLDSTSKFINLSTMSDGSSMTYQWLFDDGDTSTLENPNHIYSADGLYNVKLTVTPADTTNPCRSDSTIAVIIYPLPQTDYSFTNNCADDSIRFTNNTTISSGTITYKWHFMGGTPDTSITAMSFKYGYTAPDTNNVLLTATSDKNCPITISKPVRFYSFVDANFDSAKASVCIYDSSEFDNTSILKTKETWIYNWTFDNGATSTEKNPINYYAPYTPGFGIDSAYNVKLVITPTDTTNVCRDSITKVVYMHPLPDSSFNITLDTFCLGVKTSFIKNTAQNKHTYHWGFGDSNNDSSTTFTQHIYQTSGRFRPELTSISEYNCVSTDTQNIYVLPVPEPNFTVLRDTVCNKDTLVFVDQSDTVATKYVWNYGDGTPNDSSRSRLDTIRRKYTNPNTYNVTLTGIKGDCFKRISKRVRIEPDPVVQFTLKRDNFNGKKVDITNNSYLPNGSNGSLSFFWNYGDGTTDSTKQNFFSKTYTSNNNFAVKLKATSDFGCIDEKIDTIETVNTPASLFALSDSNVCKGDSFSFTNNSTNAQTYFWNFGDGSTSTDSVPNHIYTKSGKFLVQLIAKDTNNYSDTSSKLVTINAIPTINFSSNTNICAGGQVVFTNTSFVQSQDTLNYNWMFGDGDSSVNQNPIHRYDTGSSYKVLLQVNTSAGCSDTSSKTVNIYSGPIAKFDTASARVCAGTLSSLTNQTTIKASETISGYLWRFQAVPNQPTTTNSSVTYSKAGKYNVELVATSTRGCKDSVTYPITIDSIPTLDMGGTQNTCGTTLQLDAQNPGAKYAWSNSDTTKTITVSTSGSYSVTVTLPGANSCNTVDTVTVNLNTQVDPALGNNFSACGDTTIDAKNPGSTYNWSWMSGSATSRTLNITASGTYKVTVTDANNCIGTDSIVATITTPPSVNLGADVNVCAGLPVTLDAGNAGSKFNWSNSDTNQTVSNPATGFYIVTVTDRSTNCFTTDSIDVKYKSSPSFTLGADKQICGTQGTLLNAGSFANGSYLWSDNSTRQTLAVNQTGKYWAKITDNGNSCSTTDTVDVTINQLPAVSLNAPVSGCVGNNLQLQPVANNANKYSFSWNNNSTDSILLPTSTGLYSVTVTDTATTCVNYASSNVSVYQSPTVDLGNDTNLCNGNSILLSVGSTSYNTIWSNSTTNPALSVSQSGTYSVVATQNGCSTRDTITITQSTPPTVNLGNSSSICSNDTLSLNAGNAGSNFKWSNNDTNQVLKVTNSGFYSVTVTDTNGCTGNGNVNVQAYTAPSLNLGADDTLCQGSSKILDAKNPGASYSWNNAATSQALQVTTAGTYTVTVTDQNNCTVKDSIVVSFINPPTVNLGPNVNICSGTKDTLDAGNPGKTFSWSTGASTQTIEVTNAGTYRVTVTDGGCSASDQIVASVRPIPNVNLGADKIGCTGDSLTLTSLLNYPSGTNYSWSTSATSPSIKAAATGTYILTVTNSNSCANFDSIKVDIKSAPVINLPTNITACGDTLLDAGNTGASFAWNTNATTQTIRASQTGTYIVSVTLASCVSKDTSSVTINPLPVVNLGSDVSACINNAPTLNAGHVGKSYLWKSGSTSQTFTPSVADTIWVRVTDNVGCAGFDTVVVNFNAGVTVNLGPDMDTCHYQDIVLDAQNAGSRYIWSTGKRTQTLSVNNSGAYAVTVTDANNCSSNDAISVTLNSIPEVNLGNDRDVCDSVYLDAKNIGSTYFWSDNSTAQKLLAQNAGAYWARVTSTKGCIGRDTVTLGIKPTPVLNLGPDTSICSGSTLTLNANNTGNTVLWSNNSAAQTINVATTGKFWVKATNSVGCSKTDTIDISLGASPTVDLGADTGFCINQQLPLDAGNPGGSYIWGGPDNFTDSVKVTSVSAAGKYYVQVTTTGGCIGSDTINFTPKTDTVYAYFLATSRVEIGDTVQFVDLSYPDIKTWSYDFGDLTTSALQDPEKIYLLEDTFKVTLTVSNGSCQDSRSKDIVVNKRTKNNIILPFSDEDRIETTQFVKANLYPNPSRGSFRLMLELSQEDNVAIHFFDMRGVVHHKEIIEGVDAYVNDFHFNNLAPGMYFLQATLGRERKLFRVVITR